MRGGPLNMNTKTNSRGKSPLSSRTSTSQQENRAAVMTTRFSLYFVYFFLEEIELIIECFFLLNKIAIG